MTTTQEVQEYTDGRLDQPYVRAVAAAVAAALRRGDPIEAAFQPGDGTRYDLVFLPLDAILDSAPARIAPIRGELQEWDRLGQFGVSREPGTAIVAWATEGHGAIGLDLSCGGFVGEYLAPMFGTTLASGCALATLFNAIGDAFSAGPRAV